MKRLLLQILMLIFAIQPMVLFAERRVLAQVPQTLPLARVKPHAAALLAAHHVQLGKQPQTSQVPVKGQNKKKVPQDAVVFPSARIAQTAAKNKTGAPAAQVADIQKTISKSAVQQLPKQKQRLKKSIAQPKPQRVHRSFIRREGRPFLNNNNNKAVVGKPKKLDVQSNAQENEALQVQAKESMHESVLEQVYERGHKAQLKEMIVYPFQMAASIGKWLGGFWLASAALNKMTGWENIGKVKLSSRFTQNSFKTDVISFFPLFFAASAITQALNWGGYKLMNAVGLKAWTPSAIMAGLVHPGGYKQYKKDEKDYNHLLNIENTLVPEYEVHIFRDELIKKETEERKKMQAGLALMNDQQIIEFANSLPEQVQEIFNIEALKQLSKEELGRLEKSPEVQAKLNRIMVALIRSNAATILCSAEIPLEFAREHLKQMYAEYVQLSAMKANNKLPQEAVEKFSQLSAQLGELRKQALDSLKPKDQALRNRMLIISDKDGASAMEVKALDLNKTSTVIGLVNVLKNMFIVGKYINVSLVTSLISNVTNWWSVTKATAAVPAASAPAVPVPVVTPAPVVSDSHWPIFNPKFQRWRYNLAKQWFGIDTLGVQIN